MKEKVFNFICDAIESNTDITIEITINDKNGFILYFCPDAADLMDDDLLVYKDENVYNLRLDGEIEVIDHGFELINSSSDITITM